VTNSRPAHLGPAYVLSAVTSMGLGVVFTVLADFRDRYHIDETALGTIVAAGFFASVAAQLLLARFADRGHAQTMVRLGLVFFIASMTGMVIGTTFLVLLVARILLGVATGTIVPSLRRIAVSVDPERVGHNLGRMSAFDIGGFVTGPLLPVVLADRFGVKSSFVVLGVAAAVLLPLVVRLHDSGPLDDERAPMRNLFHRPMVGTLIASMALFTVIGSFDALWSVLLTDRGASRHVIGIGIALFGLPLVVLASVGGRIAQRQGPLRVFVLSVFVAAPCLIAYGQVTSVILLTTVAVVHSLGDAFGFPAIQVAAAMAAPPQQQAAGMGLLGAVELATAGVAAQAAGAGYHAWGPGPVFALVAAIVVGLAMAGASVGTALLRPPAPVAVPLAVEHGR
jgi:MFS family permease